MLRSSRGVAELRSLFGGAVLEEVPARYLADETEARGVRGRADAVALPRAPEAAAELVAWCYEAIDGLPTPA